jgi:hypothetical protein
MVIMKMQELFDPFFYYIVDNIDYDYKKSFVCLEVVEPTTEERHKLLFKGVTSLLWTMEGYDGKICQNVFPELSSITVLDVSLSTENKWLRNYPLQYNIAIEIMDRALLICANVAEIDGKEHFLNNCSDILDIREYNA